VSPSNVASVGYDADSQVLEVEFTSGAVYISHGVPSGHFDGLIAAVSKGNYLHARILKVYPTTKL